MARILDAETEAFAPTFKPVERVSARTMDDDLRRLGLVAGVAKEAMPLADLVARGGSTLYGGIKDWFAEKGQKEDAEKAKARGVKGLDDFAATETNPQPGPTAAVAKGDTQEIAKQRLEAMTPEEEEKAAEDWKAARAKEHSEQQAGMLAQLRSAVGNPEKQQEIMQKIRESERPTFGASIMQTPGRESMSLQKGKVAPAGDMHLDWFTQPAREEAAPSVTTKGERLRLPTTTYTEEFGGIPAGAMTAAPADITRKVNDPGRTGQVSYPAAPPRSTAAELVAEKKAEVEAATKKPVALEKPSAPKTIGQATDSQLDVIQRKLQAAAQANPSDAGIAERLKDVTDELEYRATKDMPRTYEQWSALARMADTPEKQARVLEMAKNVHMPVAGLADLLTPSSQLAERQAMGTSTERGLFPAMAKQASELDLAKAAKAWSESRRLDLRNPYDLALLQAHIEESKAKSGLSDAKTSDIIAMIPSKVEAMEELGHQRHEMAGYYSAKAKAEDARSRLRGMGGGRGNIKNLEFIARELGDRRKEEVGEAKAAAESAKRDAITNEAYYRQAADRYEMAAAAVPTEPPEDPGPFARESIKAQYRRDKQAYDQKANEAKTAASIRDQAKAKLDEANGIVRQREQLVVDSITAGQQDRDTVDALHREIAGPGGAKLLPPAKPPTAQPAAAPTTAPASGLPKGVKLTGETKVGTPKGGTEKMVWGKGSDGKWYPIRKAP